MLEDYNAVLDCLQKFYHAEHHVFRSMERIKKDIKELAQQTHNKQSYVGGQMRSELRNACELIGRAVADGEFGDANSRLELGQYMLSWQRSLVARERKVLNSHI